MEVKKAHVNMETVVWSARTMVVTSAQQPGALSLHWHSGIFPYEFLVEHTDCLTKKVVSTVTKINQA